MGKYVQKEVERYYDSHPTVEDLMGETSFHADLVHYLMEVLRWLFHEQACAIYENLNFYHTSDEREYPIAPDIAVIKGVPYRYLRSWTIDATGPAPQVVFEIASKETWRSAPIRPANAATASSFAQAGRKENDLGEKPFKYAFIGVQEYFLYDPETPQNMKSKGRRLIGWRLNRATGAMEDLLPNSEGWLWSNHLDSFLVPDGVRLRFYDSTHKLRLTGEEARQQRTLILEEKLRELGLNPDEL
jgi:Uma2 family endonuclease